jgi:TPR repeat protein
MAAEQGNADAQFNLGRCYAEGQGVAKDLAAAATLYQKAAEQGNATAQLTLASCYDLGTGVAKDLTAVVKWYRKAAEQGVSEAQAFLGFRYQEGQGVAKDSVEAVRWYRRGAEQGNDRAQLGLSMCYREGDGVVKNEIESYKWLLLAASQGNEKIKEFIANAEKRLSPAQRADGQRLAQEWEAKNAKQDAARGNEKHPDIAASGEEPKITGTGFMITRNGYLMTNHHVVKDSSKVRVQTAAGLLAAEIVRVDAASDLALLKVTGSFDALPVVSSRAVRLGAMVATVGFPTSACKDINPNFPKAIFPASP